VQCNTALALVYLASGSLPIQAAIAAQPDAVPALVRLLGSSDELVQGNAAIALASLAYGNVPIQAAIAAQPGAIPALRSLVGTRDYPEAVRRIAADLLAVLDSQAMATRAAACAGCGSLPAGGRSHKLCKGCRALRYCGPDCQKRHWPQHKRACQVATAARG
jgi:hypothetical protein